MIFEWFANGVFWKECKHVKLLRIIEERWQFWHSDRFEAKRQISMATQFTMKRLRKKRRETKTIERNIVRRERKSVWWVKLTQLTFSGENGGSVWLRISISRVSEVRSSSAAPSSKAIDTGGRTMEIGWIQKVRFERLLCVYLAGLTEIVEILSRSNVHGSARFPEQ
jgi:hypothetical protein